jgi:hypothetical protein
MTDSQKAVLKVVIDYGPLPDHALVPLTQHVAGVHQSSSGIRTRRAELSEFGLVEATGDYIKMPSGRRAAVWGAVAGAEKVLA